MKKHTFPTALALLLLTAVTAAAAEWQLPGIDGHQPSYWNTKGPNWKWDDGNPRTDQGAQWLLFYQPDNRPEPGGTVKPLVKGLAWKYNYVWRDDSTGTDPQFFYLSRSLTCGSRKDYGHGPASGVMFIPAATGKFAVELDAGIKVQNPSAGHARVAVYLLDRKTGDTSLLRETELNTKGGHGGFPDAMTWNQTLEIPAGTALVVRVQSINPGPGSCGKSTLTFRRFRVTTP